MPTRRDWLLLLIGDGLDPIRIQKGMFLFAMEAPAPAGEKYEFEPYNWGPFSPPIYADLEALQLKGLVEREQIPGASYYRYRLTPKGETAAGRLTAAPAALATMRSIRETIRGLGFNALLRQVYAKYPEFAVNSLFKAK